MLLSDRSPAPREGMGSVVMTTPAPEAGSASWATTAARSGKTEAGSPQETSGVECVWSTGEASLQIHRVGSRGSLRWASLGSRKRGGACALFATCLHLSTPAPGGPYVVPQMCS